MALELTPRQREIIALVCVGEPNKVIAHELGISEGTVQQHLHRIFLRMNCGNRAEMAFKAGKESRL